MFSSKTQKEFKEAKKLVTQRKWHEAIAALQALQDAKDIDQVELLIQLNQAKDGLRDQQIGIANEAIKRKSYSDAARLLESLSKEHPNHPEITRLMQQAKEGQLSLEIEAARRAIRSKYYSEAMRNLEVLQANYPDNMEVPRLIAQAKDAEHQDKIQQESRQKFMGKIRVIGGGNSSSYVPYLCCSWRSGKQRFQ